MPPPPQPDGGFNIPQKDTSSGAYGQNSLWDLSGLSTDPIITQAASHFNGINRLDPGDRAIAERSTAEQNGLPSDLVKYPIDLYAKDPKAYLALQQQLYQGGFYGSTPASSIPWGTDPAGSTYDAYKKVLIAAQQAQAIGHSLTPDQVLAQAIQQHQAAAAAGPSGKPGMVVQYSDPAVLRGLVQQAAQASLGRNLSTEQVNAFVNEFHAQEAAFSKKNYAAQLDQTGKEFDLTQPNAAAQAQEFVDQSNPKEEGGQLLASYVGRLQQMLSGG
jgi:hypothetical protein